MKFHEDFHEIGNEHLMDISRFFVHGKKIIHEIS
jgi:hypothetical protein